METKRPAPPQNRPLADNTNADQFSGQARPVGPHPDVSLLLLGSLMWGTPFDAAEALLHVRDDDLPDPAAAAVLAAVRSLAGAGKLCSPQLVADELRRVGQFRGHVPDRLRDATTSGAAACAARDYAAAVVAESLRRRVETAGHALTTAAPTAAECELAPLVAGAAAAVADCAHRLALLRGEAVHGD